LTDYREASVAEANALYKAAAYSGRAAPDDLLPGLFSTKGELICVARLRQTKECTASDYVLLRNLCTLPAMRRQGLAQQLCNEILAQTQIPVFLFPLPELTDFYQRAGFNQITAAELPPDLTYQWHKARKNLPGVLPMKFAPGEERQ